MAALEKRGRIRYFWKISSSAVLSPTDRGDAGSRVAMVTNHLPHSGPGVIFLGLIYCFN